MKKPNYIYDIVSILEKYFKVDANNDEVYNLLCFNVCSMLCDIGRELKGE